MSDDDAESDYSPEGRRDTTPEEILAFLWQFGWNPGFWWAWEAVGLFLFYITKLSRGIGADKHIVLQWTGNSWRKAGEKWVKKSAESWGKMKGRVNQAEATAYTETGFMSEHGVQFTDMDHTLPMKVEFSIVPHNPVGKYSKKADGKIVFKEDKKYSVNPSVKSLEELIGRQVARQLNIANSIAKQPIQMLLIIAALGFLAGYVLYPYLPHAGA